MQLETKTNEILHNVKGGTFQSIDLHFRQKKFKSTELARSIIV